MPVAGAIIGVAVATTGGIARERALGTTDWSELIQWGVIADPGFFPGLFVGGIGGGLLTAVLYGRSKDDAVR